MLGAASVVYRLHAAGVELVFVDQLHLCCLGDSQEIGTARDRTIKTHFERDGVCTSLILGAGDVAEVVHGNKHWGGSRGHEVVVIGKSEVDQIIRSRIDPSPEKLHEALWDQHRRKYQ